MEVQQAGPGDVFVERFLIFWEFLGEIFVEMGVFGGGDFRESIHFESVFFLNNFSSDNDHDHDDDGLKKTSYDKSPHSHFPSWKKRI